MNFLAHSVLGFDDDALVAGQIAGDFVRGTDLSALGARAALGARLHRAIDARTDAHPALAALRRRVPAPLRRFAGVALDIGLDHVIARTWPRAAVAALEAGPLPVRRPPAADLHEHAERVGAALEGAAPRLPEPVLRFAPHLVRTMPRWADPEGVAATLERLSRRSPRWAPLARTPAELERLDGALEGALEALWPELLGHARDMLVHHGARGDRR